MSVRGFVRRGRTSRATLSNSSEVHMKHRKWLIAALLIVITAGFGLYGIQGWSGTSGGHWVVVFGSTLILPAMWTESWILGGLIHIGFWIGVAWGVSAIWRAIRAIKKDIAGSEDQQAAVREYRRLLIIGVLVTLALGGVGFALTPIIVNILGFLLFWWSRTYNQDQGLGFGLLFLGMYLSIPGALYGVASGILMSVAGRRWPDKKRRIGTALAIGYLVLFGTTVLVIGLFTIHVVAGRVGAFMACVLLLLLGTVLWKWVKPPGESRAITRPRAHLYAVGWLICWCVPTVPMAMRALGLSEDDPMFYTLIACSLLLLGCLTITAALMNRSWCVAIALLVQAGAVLGVGIGLAAILLIGAASHPV